MVFNHINPDDVKYYIINDEFVEIRKALAEGKTVQYNFGNHGINKKDFPNKWKDLDILIGILADKASPKNYRIKPEEPKVKIGDWCWFWNKGTTLTVLELLEIVDDGNRKYFAAMPNIPHSLGGYYQYCEPFFGTLPTKLQK